MDNAKLNQNFTSNGGHNNSSLFQVQNLKSFSLAQQLSRAFSAQINQLQIHPDDDRELYLYLMFQRFSGNYQASLLLAEQGMLHQMQIMQRCLLEILFELEAFRRHPEVLEAMFQDEDDQRRHVLNSVYQRQQIYPTLTTDELAQLHKMIKSADNVQRSDFKTCIKAELAGMLHEYRTQYSMLSGVVHSSLSSLRFDIYSEQQQAIVSHDNAADRIDEIDEQLMSSANYVLNAEQCLLQLFKVPGSDEFATLAQQIQLEWQRIITAVQHR